MSKPGRLIIICGLPGVGKTTLAREMEQKTGRIRFCPDEWLEALSLDLWEESRRNAIEALQWQLGLQLLKNGLTLILEWGTWSRSERDRLRQQAKALGASVELYYLTAAKESLLKRIRERGRETPPITEADLADWIDHFQVPTADEMSQYEKALTIRTD